jgi:molybdate transport system regulatory protein
MARPTLSLRIELPNGSRLGPGKIGLLESVRARRSIASAAREHAMSYRRAWLLIDDMNRAFKEPVVATFPGRSHGTGATVTAFGERLIAIFRAAERRAAKAVAAQFDEVAGAIDKSYAPRELSSRDPKSAGRVA